MKDILDYMKDYHKDSNMSNIHFDRLSASKIIEYYITHRDSLPLVALEDEKIIGLLFGSLEPYFFNQKKSYATDLLFFSKGAGPQLWKKFVEWAFSVGADRIIMGVSSGDERAGQLLEALGMNATGGMYELCEKSSQGSI
jgi:hypothetical protein